MLLSTAVLFLAGILLSRLAAKLRLPPLLGMLIAGLLLGPYALNLLTPNLLGLAGELRQFALVVILIRLGLAINLTDVKAIGSAVFLLALVPATLEIAAITLVGPLVLGITVLEAALLGVVLAAVSPAVIVPQMLKLMGSGYGTANRIPALIMVSASLNGIYVLVLFSVFLNKAISGQDFQFVRLLDIPVSVVLGLALGLIAGWLMSLVFTWLDLGRISNGLIVLAVGFLLFALEQAAAPAIPISALLAVVVSVMLVAQRNSQIAINLADAFADLWVPAELMLFGLVGAAINVPAALPYILPAFVIVLVGLVFRAFGSYLSLVNSRLNRNERLFVCLSNTPKATIQAAIAAIPLAAGVPAGGVILAVAMLAILLTAPLAAFAMNVTYQKLLTK